MFRIGTPKTLTAALFAAAGFFGLEGDASAVRLAQGVCSPIGQSHRALVRFTQFGADNLSSTEPAAVSCGGDRGLTGATTWIGVYDRSPTDSVACILRYAHPDTNLMVFSQSQATPASESSAGIYWLTYPTTSGLDVVPNAICVIPPVTSAGVSHVTTFYHF